MGEGEKRVSFFNWKFKSSHSNLPKSEIFIFLMRKPLEKKKELKIKVFFFFFWNTFFRNLWFKCKMKASSKKKFYAVFAPLFLFFLPTCIFYSHPASFCHHFYNLFFFRSWVISIGNKLSSFSSLVKEKKINFFLLSNLIFFFSSLFLRLE